MEPRFDSRRGGNGVVIVLILIILILLGVIAYSFLIRPAFNSYVVKKQIEAKDLVLNTLLMQIQQNGYVQISDTNGNSIVLVPSQNQPTQQQSPNSETQK